MFRISRFHRVKNLESLILFAGLVAISIISKGSLVLKAEQNLDSDQSIPLLMAKRILELKEFPFFYWGQNYMGLLEVWLALPFLAILGTTIQTFTIVEIFFSILLSFVLYLHFKNAGEENLGIAISIIFAMGHPDFNSHLVNVSENYISSLFLGFSGFYFIRKLFEKDLTDKFYLGIGILFGLAFYNREILLIILPWMFLVTAPHWKKNFRKIFHILPGFFIGYLPAILHYLTTPYYRKLVRPSISFSSDLQPGLNFIKSGLLDSIVMSGDSYFSISMLIPGAIGLFHFFSEKNNLIRKYFLYYLLGALSSLFLFTASGSYMLVRYFFYLQCIILFFAAYGLSALYKKQKIITIILVAIIGLAFSFQSFQLWKKNLAESQNTPDAKRISEFLTANHLKYGFCEYWAGYVTSYFSHDKVHCLIYLDKQSDFYSAYQVISNRADFFLFRKDSPFEKQFLQTVSQSRKFTKKEIGKLILYISPVATLDFLEPNRDALLKELKIFQK